MITNTFIYYNNNLIDLSNEKIKYNGVTPIAVIYKNTEGVAYKKLSPLKLIINFDGLNNEILGVNYARTGDRSFNCSIFDFDIRNTYFRDYQAGNTRNTAETIPQILIDKNIAPLTNITFRYFNHYKNVNTNMSVATIIIKSIKINGIEKLATPFYTKTNGYTDLPINLITYDNANTIEITLRESLATREWLKGITSPITTAKLDKKDQIVVTKLCPWKQTAEGQRVSDMFNNITKVTGTLYYGRGSLNFTASNDFTQYEIKSGLEKVKIALRKFVKYEGEKTFLTFEMRADTRLVTSKAHAVINNVEYFVDPYLYEHDIPHYLTYRP